LEKHLITMSVAFAGWICRCFHSRWLYLNQWLHLVSNDDRSWQEFDWGRGQTSTRRYHCNNHSTKL